MEANFIFTATTITANTVMAILVYLHDHKSASNRSFIFLTITIIFWSLVNLLSIRMSEYTLWLARLVLFFALPMQFSFFLFAHTFPAKVLRIKKKNLVFLVLTVLVSMGLPLTP